MSLDVNRIKAKNKKVWEAGGEIQKFRYSYHPHQLFIFHSGLCNQKWFGIAKQVSKAGEVVSTYVEREPAVPICVAIGVCVPLKRCENV